MDQFEKILDFVKSMCGYLVSGKMECSQVPVDDIIYVIKEEYNRVSLDSNEACESYRALMVSCINRDDRRELAYILESIIHLCKALTAFYGVKTAGFDLQIHPYKVEVAYYRNKERNTEWKKNNKLQKEPSFKGKGAVYTAITGGYDIVHDPVFVDENLDYYLFTDNENIKSNVFKVVKVDNVENLDPVRLARKIKIVGNWEYLQDYDYTIWTDGKLQIIGDLNEYIVKYAKGAPLLCFNHHDRDDLYDEAQFCAARNTDSSEMIYEQTERYRTEGFPEHYGLTDTCFLIKDNKSIELKKAMMDWWNEVKNGSKRDQISFCYAFWKNNLIYDTSPLISIDNKYVRTYRHSN